MDSVISCSCGLFLYPLEESGVKGKLLNPLFFDFELRSNALIKFAPPHMDNFYVHVNLFFNFLLIKVILLSIIIKKKIHCIISEKKKP